MLVFELPRFFPHREQKGAAISKQSILLTPTSRSNIVLALRLRHFL